MFGLDSCRMVDDCVTENLYRPPQYAPEMHGYLITASNKKYYHDIMVSRGVGDSIVKIVEITQPSYSECTLIYSHGNGEDIYTAFEDLYGLSQLFKCRVVSYDYPGYGLTPGRPSEAGCVSALRTVVDQYKHKPLILIGRSLGTGVTVQYAYERKWTQPIVLISPYKSIGRVVCDTSLVDYLFKNNTFCNLSKMSSLKCPVRIIHGVRDTLITVEHGRALYELLKFPLSPRWKEDCDHNNITLERDDLEDILDMLAYAPNRIGKDDIR